MENTNDCEVKMLQKVECELRRHERCERIHHIVMATLGLMAISAFFAGRRCRRCCNKDNS